MTGILASITLLSAKRRSNLKLRGVVKFAGASVLQARAVPKRSLVGPPLKLVDGVSYLLQMDGESRILLMQPRASTIAVSSRLAGVGGLAAYATGQKFVYASLSGSSDLFSTADVAGTQLASAMFAGASAFSAVAIEYQSASATFAGASTLSASASSLGRWLHLTDGVSYLLLTDGVSHLRMMGSQGADVTFVGSSTFSAYATAKQSVRITFAGVGDLAATPSARQSTAVTLAGESSFAAAANQRQSAAALLAGNSTLVGAAETAGVIDVAATLAGTSTFAADTKMWQRAIAQFDGASTLSADALRQQFASAVLAGESTLAAGVEKYQFASAAFAGASALSADASQVIDMPVGYLHGCTLSNAADTTNDITVSAGTVAADTAPYAPMVLASAITKQLDVAWAVGTNAGGRDTGAISNATWHVWLIQRSDTGVVDVLFSLSATSPTMPANYDRKRRIGSIIRITNTIMQFLQNGDTFIVNDGTVADFSWSSVNARSWALLTLVTIPTGIRVQPLLQGDAWMDNSSATIDTYMSFSDGRDSGGNTGQKAWWTRWAGEAVYWTIPGGIFTNTSAQIYMEVIKGTGGVILGNRIYAYGWIDDRGRSDVDWTS